MLSIFSKRIAKLEAENRSLKFHINYYRTMYVRISAQRDAAKSQAPLSATLSEYR